MKNQLTRTLLPAENHPVENAVPVFRRYPHATGGIHAMIEHYVLEEIHNEIESLPEQCRAVFRLTFFDELSTEQVANRLNMPIKTVVQYKQQALMGLRFTLLRQCLSAATG